MTCTQLGHVIYPTSEVAGRTEREHRSLTINKLTLAYQFRRLTINLDILQKLLYIRTFGERQTCEQRCVFISSRTNIIHRSYYTIYYILQNYKTIRQWIEGVGGAFEPRASEM